MSQLNRRTIITGSAALAALPVATLPAHADIGPGDKRLDELEQQIAIADARTEAFGNTQEEAEHAMLAWERRNPKPRTPDIAHERRKLGDWNCAHLAAEDRAKFRAQNPRPDPEELMAEHRRAVKRWEKGQRVARADCRYYELEAEYNRLIEQADALRYEAARVKAKTIAGLRSKAAMLKDFDPSRDDHGELADSIIADLQAWPAQGGR